uniref:Anti-silencing function protein 1 n=1 Tax=Chromera velia CCMP2878 TaxID=1169474 RepID=A0A0G4GHI7_9ALVE|eukprot:Cvel_665.t1-p1 / transcript=Cvel_665.t1 / gene=Cvel_665 / organism=Chromera_velia_CCMP2878 / gene_product=Histone chaperone ASF1, putative / transcript_product=Histone chaperone ASF1, putative / location=Cvel_scaffold20:159087-161128(-) / protein_length=239 / sequence_SO=supercontig / SO=protein_coding / is_pseudo=false
MACVNVLDVQVKKNPSGILDKFCFEISLECTQPLTEDVEWKITYIGDPESQDKDQELEAIDLGPLKEVGQLKFIFECDPPDYEKIDEDNIVGLSAVMITASYKGHQFIRISYYLRNYYEKTELADCPPDKPDLPNLKRQIFSEQARVTKFSIPWDEAQADADGTAGEGDGEEEEEEGQAGKEDEDMAGDGGALPEGSASAGGVQKSSGSGGGAGALVGSAAPSTVGDSPIQEGVVPMQA